MPKISVIVAAYNAELYLRRCLDSIASQTFQDWECIIVNDGSRDRTGFIAEEYVLQDNRFHVIHQENKGVSSARQRGLDHASGEYIIHADSDDWVDSSMLEELYVYAKSRNADILICDLMHIQNNRTDYYCQRPLSLVPEVVLGQLMLELHGSLCNKLIKKSTIDTYHICFDQSLKICEDQYFVMQLLLHPVRVEYINRAFYHYDRTKNPNSLVNAPNILAKRVLPLEKISSLTSSSIVKDYYCRALLRMAYDVSRGNNQISPKEFKLIFGKHRREIMKASGFPFHVKLVLFLRLYISPRIMV